MPELPQPISPPQSPPWRVTLPRVAFVLAATLVVALLRFNTPGIPDPDSFYHFRHAAEYAHRGWFTADFPWLPYTILGRYQSDIGYGFHLFLIPFTAVANPVTGAALASVVETVIVMVMCYFVLLRRGIRYAAGWPFVLVLLSPPIIWTVFQTRPQTLTMGFVALLLSAMVSGSALGIFTAAFLTSFLHLNVIAIIPVIIGVIAVVKGLIEHRWEWRVWLAALFGVTLGWALRPHPLGTARLEYVQTVVHEVVRKQGLPLLFGREWLPVEPAALNSFLYFIVLWIGLTGLVLAALAMRKQRVEAGVRTFLWSSLALSLVFFAGMMLVTKRLTPFWATTAVLFCAQGFSCFLDPLRRSAEETFDKDGRAVTAFAVVVILLAMVGSGLNEHLLQHRWRAIPPGRMEASAQWIRGHAKPREVVFNTDWGMFPELFFWDPDRRYTSGLDPIFLFANNPSLYWKAHYLQTGEATDHTWATPRPSQESAEDTYRVLREDFDASYIVLEKARQSGLYHWLASDPRFVLGHEDERYAVFAVAD